ncbi:ABC transporter ATP-binding protein [Cohnella xylanilytica]|uniref:Carnitine transport ATP-binding protein OpuCA n=1 Tax=Cohnella xylanilytica TaxID=557555 RepID=A0A841U1B8_9BACL|nr:ABC transporter ATP-binding protein [Cohnella xylanilytica]MBB6693232.1 ABC transporter ATP-binding protein [Cohnella xylanilytica]GIO16686.1 ABC transporter ATP-binding protein [Cohnella xylanilytica]
MIPILEANGLRKSFGGHPALRGINFSVAGGEIISVLGPSGCGKSTLLQLIAGLQQPDEGEIKLRGETVSSASRLIPPEKRRINMVFQDYALWPHMTVYDNIAYGLKRKKASSADIRAKIESLLGLLHLGGLEDRLPAQLSGGQQQRVAIARALATEPDLLLLDEPLSNLDMKLRIEMRTEMAYLFRKLGTTVFHVTHDPEEAFAMADRLIIMRNGASDQIDEPQSCYRLPATRSAAALLGAGNRLAGKAVAGDTPAIRIGEGDAASLLRGTAPGDWSGDAAAEALFRPDAAVWEEDASGSPRDSNRLAVRVVHSSYEGNRWRVLAETESGGRVAFFRTEPLASGTSGALTVSVSDLYLYPHS